MTIIRKPAVRITQGENSLFLTSFTVREFKQDNFYRVDRLDLRESTGMQRLLNMTRARSFSRDIQSASNKNAAFLPTSVFLATSGVINYDDSKRELFFDTDEQGGICPLDVVDGQHRIEGLKLASENNEQLRDFPIPVVIADNLTELQKMLQFVVVNTKQKAVDKGVEQHIIARFTRMREVEDVPHLPSWLQQKVEKGEEDQALDIIIYLNEEVDSPWYGRIRLADNDEKDPNLAIKQATFAKKMKDSIFSRNHPLHQFESKKRMAILKNFWNAVREIFVEPNEDISKSVAFKSSGSEFFFGISGPIINILAKNRTYTKDAIKECILSAEDYLDEPEILTYEYWVVGGIAGGLNTGGMNKKVALFAEALSRAAEDDMQI